jgi:hypothetical protein
MLDGVSFARTYAPQGVAQITWRAWSYSMAGELDKALADSDALIRLYPNAEWAYMTRITYRAPNDHSGKRSDLYRRSTSTATPQTPFACLHSYRLTQKRRRATLQCCAAVRRSPSVLAELCRNWE